MKVLARAHQHVGRQRRDFHHKTALILLRNYDTISLEDLRVTNMMRNRCLSSTTINAVDNRQMPTNTATSAFGSKARSQSGLHTF